MQSLERDELGKDYMEIDVSTGCSSKTKLYYSYFGHLAEDFWKEHAGDLKMAWESSEDSIDGENPFTEWRWFRICTAHYKKAHQIIITAETDASSLNILAVNLLWRGRLKSAIDPIIGDYYPILKEYATISELLSQTLTVVEKDFSCKSVDLYPLRSIDMSCEEGVLNQGGFFGFVTEYCKNYFINTSTQYEIYISSLNKKLRQELRTCSNKLNRIGEWTFKVAETTEERLLYLDQLKEYHIIRQSNKSGISIFNNEVFNDILDKILDSNETLESTLHLSSIIVNGVPVSIALGIVTNKVYYYWVPSFNNSKEYGSVGKIHIQELIQYCCVNDIKRFDFMGGDEKYKTQWTSEYYRLWRYRGHRMKWVCNYIQIKVWLKAYLKEVIKRNQNLRNIKNWVQSKT